MMSHRFDIDNGCIYKNDSIKEHLNLSRRRQQTLKIRNCRINNGNATEWYLNLFSDKIESTKCIQRDEMLKHFYV